MVLRQNANCTHMNGFTFYDRMVAETFSTDHQSHIFSGEDLRLDMANAFASMDQPTFDGLNSYYICKMAKSSGVTTALSGQGGDEVFKIWYIGQVQGQDKPIFDVVESLIFEEMVADHNRRPSRNRLRLQARELIVDLDLRQTIRYVGAA